MLKSFIIFFKLTIRMSSNCDCEYRIEFILIREREVVDI